MRQAVRAIIVRDDQILVMHRNKFGHEYYILVGGGVDAGETPERALACELYEETGFTLLASKLVFTQEMPEPYGTQFIYICQAQGDTPALAPDSEEAKINMLGKNLYMPLWLPLADLPTVPFRTPAVQQAIVLAQVHGYPDKPVALSGAALEKVQENIANKKG